MKERSSENVMMEVLSDIVTDQFDASDICVGNWQPMMLVRKKPIIVHATQMNFPEGFKVETLEGTMCGKQGDYLVIGIDGEKYPVDKSIFERSYDIIGDSTLELHKSKQFDTSQQIGQPTIATVTNAVELDSRYPMSIQGK